MPRWPLLHLSIALTAAVLCCASLNLFDDWTLEEMPVRFVAAGMLCGIVSLFAINEFLKVARASSLRPDDEHKLEARATLPLRSQAIIFWAVAIALRLVALPLTPGDDLWRYEWEGKIQRAGFNPYIHAPDDPQLEPVRAEYSEWNRINHRDFRAIYPPGAELLFAGLSGISDQPLLYKLLFTAADLGTAALLLRLLGGTSRYANAAWYAWNPLVVYSFAGAAHFDSLMVLPMVAGIFFLTRFEAATEFRRKWLLALAASASFGIAISVKLVPILLLLSCVFALGFRAIALLVSVGIPALLSTLYGWPKIHIWESLGRFAHVTRLNDLFWWLIEETVWPNPHQKRGMLWAFGTALILSPVLHPWYCTWILPLAAWRRAYGWFVFSVTLFAYFLFWNERLFLLPWHSEPWMRGIIIIPALAAAVLSGLARRTQRNVTS
jgi:hypothetical protein